MSVRTGQSVTVEFPTQRFDTGAATNADSTPSGTLVLNGVDNGASVTVTNVDTGRYKAAVTLPTLAVGDIVELYISATVNSVAGKAIVWRDTKDVVIDSAGLVDANTVKVGPSGSGSAQAARDLGTSVLLSNGTGTGQISLSTGAVTVSTLPTIPNNWITAAGIASAALNGKGDWDTSVPPTAAAIAAATRDVDNTSPAANSLGAKVNSAASAGDPWTTSVPGVYNVGTAGYVIGHFLDAQVSLVPGLSGLATLASGDIDGYSLEQTNKLLLAASVGKTSGAKTTSFSIRAADDSRTRVVAVLDLQGNRTGVTVDVTG